MQHLKRFSIHALPKQAYNASDMLATCWRGARRAMQSLDPARQPGGGGGARGARDAGLEPNEGSFSVVRGLTLCLITHGKSSYRNGGPNCSRHAEFRRRPFTRHAVEHVGGI